MAQGLTNSKYGQEDKFRQLEEILPTANDYRAASGAPGHRYWQQKVDYDIAVELDDAKQRIIGRETITYLNNSPDTLSYLWLQLDANIFGRMPIRLCLMKPRQSMAVFLFAALRPC